MNSNHSYSDFQSQHESIQGCVSCFDSDLRHFVSVLVGGKLYTRISLCNNCGLVFRSYRWTLNESERRYWSFAEVVGTDWESVTNNAQESRRYQRYKRNLEWIEEYKERVKYARVLDIACGPGTGLVPFLESGYSVTGIDLHPSRVRYAFEKYGIRVLQGTFEGYDFQNLTFDVIICSHFLEHAHQPFIILKKIRRLLPNDGVLYVEVPNHFNYASLSDALYMAHNNNFTPLSLKNLLQIAGFKIIAEFEPQTRFHPEAPRHIGIIAMPENGRSYMVVNPDGQYFNSVVNAYLKSTNMKSPDKLICSHIKYLFSNEEHVETLVNESFTPKKVFLNDNGELIVRIVKPNPRLNYAQRYIRECLAKCGPLKRTYQIVRKHISKQ